MADYSLPLVDQQGENYFWLINKYGYYPGGCRGDYTHGGLSLAETIIPFAVLEKKETDFQAPELKVAEMNLISEQESELELIIVNHNQYPLRELELQLKKLGVSSRESVVKSNDLVKLNINLLPAEAGELAEEVQLSFYFAGQQKVETKPLSLMIEASSKTKIDQSLNDSRDLF